LHLGLSGFTPLAMYVGAIIAMLLAIFWKPQVALYYLVPLLPMQVYRYTIHQFFAGDKLVDLLLIATIIGLFVHNRGQVFLTTPLNRFLLFFIVFFYVMLWRGAFFLNCNLPIFATDPRFSEWKNLIVVPVVLFLVVASTIKDAKQMKILLLLMCVSTLGINRGFYNTVSGRDFSHFANDLRYAGALGFAGENGFAAFEAQFCLLCLGIYVCSRRWLHKFALLGVIASCVYCVMFSFSRGAYLGFLAGIAFIGAIKERKLLVLLLVFLLAWTTVVPVSVQQRVNGTYDAEGNLDRSAEDRVDLWQDAIGLAENNLAIGTGFNTYAYMHRIGPFRDTHNLYLKAVVETGILGLVLLLVLFARCFLEGWRLFRAGRDDFACSLGLGFATLMICTVIVNLFGDRWNYLQVTGYTWVLLGLVVRARQITDHQDITEAEVPSEALCASAIGVTGTAN
jgi:putative inorganic carbon (HCO3(-)) transporter